MRRRFSGACQVGLPNADAELGPQNVFLAPNVSRGGHFFSFVPRADLGEAIAPRLINGFASTGKAT